MPQYLLDANVLIDAHRDYYPVSRVPEFWAWLVHVGGLGRVKIPLEIYEEILAGDDALAHWARGDVVRTSLQLDEAADPNIVSRVIEEGYVPDLTDDELEKIGRDPFLIAYSLAKSGERCVVTTEVSSPKKQRANRRVPDVCGTFSLLTCDTFQFLRDLDFRTDWQTS